MREGQREGGKEEGGGEGGRGERREETRGGRRQGEGGHLSILLYLIPTALQCQQQLPGSDAPVPEVRSHPLCPSQVLLGCCESGILLLLRHQLCPCQPPLHKRT